MHAGELKVINQYPTQCDLSQDILSAQQWLVVGTKTVSLCTGAQHCPHEAYLCCSLDDDQPEFTYFKR